MHLNPIRINLFYLLYRHAAYKHKFPLISPFLSTKKVKNFAFWLRLTPHRRLKCYVNEFRRPVNVHSCILVDFWPVFMGIIASYEYIVRFVEVRLGPRDLTMGLKATPVSFITSLIGYRYLLCHCNYLWYKSKCCSFCQMHTYLLFFNLYDTIVVAIMP